MIKRIATGVYKQILDNNEERWTRYYSSGSWSEWIKNVSKKDFAVITGSMQLQANSSENALEGRSTVTETNIDYPNGFNKDNCVVVSYSRTGSGKVMYSNGWKNGGTDALDMYNGIDTFTVSLYGTTSNTYSNKIRVIIGNLSTSVQNIDYKIVLMKIS